MTDTCAQEVERLAKWGDGEAYAAYGEYLVDDPEDHEGAQSANLLRALLAERDRYKARAERAEAALRGIIEGERFHLNGLEKWHRCQDIATDALAQIDAEPTEPRQPTVQEAARVLLQGGDYLTFAPAFSAMDQRFEEGPEVAFTAALRALAEGQDNDEST